ncbi:MAG: threonine synthase [Trueperaceae bacterium]
MPPELEALECVDCGKEAALTHRTKCPRCGGILDARYRGDSEEWRQSFLTARASAERSMWRWRQLLPTAIGDSPVTLGEGGTPLVRSERPTEWGGVRDLWFKVENANPTGSFKDRPVSMALTKAREWGVGGVVTASSGNAGAAVAAYAARAGLPAVVLVPDDLPTGKAAQIAMHGATLLSVTGHFSRAYDLALAWAQRSGWYDVTSTLLSAYPTEANRTVAWELWSELGRVPDWILVPVSSGPLLVGIHKGFEELRQCGLIDRLPRMVAVQAAGCAPIARAFDAGDVEVEAWGDPKTVASGIRDPLQGYANDGTLTLRRVRESRGAVIAVDDQAIMDAADAIAIKEGVAAEPTGAVAVAGAIRMIEQGEIAPDASVVCMVTGHGLKDLGAYLGRRNEAISIAPDLNEMIEAIEGIVTKGS